MRAIPAEALLRATDRQFQPIVDGYVVPEDPYRVFARGGQARIPVLLGSNANERGNYPQPKTVEEYRAFTVREYRDQANEALKVFPVDRDEDASKAYLVRQRDSVAADIHLWARTMDKIGAPVVVYYFDRRLPPRAGETPLGPVHAAEIVYFLNLLETVDAVDAPRSRSRGRDVELPRTIRGNRRPKRPRITGVASLHA